jgi:hypothetical protein
VADEDEQTHTGGMIALVPSQADISRLTVAGGDAPDELHLTLLYLGDDVSTWPPEIGAQLATLAGGLASHCGPCAANVFGWAVFNPDARPVGETEAATVYMVGNAAEGDMITPLRERAQDGANIIMGAFMPAQHDPFVQHVTAGYGVPVTDLDPNCVGPVTFDRLRLALGGTVTDYPLTGGQSMYAAADEPDSDTQPLDLPDYADGVPATFPVVIVEGVETSDHRYIEPGALSHRALPIPVLAQVQNTGDGHTGATIVGKITELTRVAGPDVISKETGEPFPEGSFVWTGKGELDPDAAATTLARRGYLTGNSADLSDMQAEYEFIDSERMAELMAKAEAGDEQAKMDYIDAEQRLVVTGGKIAATTLVAIPAFAEAYVVIDGQEMVPAADLDAVAASAWTSAELGDDCLLCELLASAEQFDAEGYAAGKAPNAEKRARALKKGLAMPPAKGKPAGEASYPVENAADLDNAIRAVGRGGAGHDAIRKHIISAAKKLGLSSKIPDNWAPDGSLKSVAASALADLPAAHWFANPALSGPTALTVGEDGHVYGHLATWGTCHIGFAGQCVTPPRSASDYAYFATGAVRVRDDDGELRTVAVGHITMGTGHASTRLSSGPAAEHYDNTGSAVADVAAGEDQYGIWVAGRARPGADLDLLRAHALSGDWRKIGGRLELVAALGVNVGGFPVPRARIASGEVETLVAAGAVKSTPVEAPPASGAVVLDYDQLADAIALRLNGKTAPAAEQDGLDTGGDATGTSALAEQRLAALATFGLDDATRAATARRDIVLAANPF